MILATGNAIPELDGERIVLTIPSGKDDVQIALSPHQALMLEARLARFNRSMMHDFKASSGEVVLFATTKRRKRTKV